MLKIGIEWRGKNAGARREDAMLRSGIDLDSVPYLTVFIFRLKREFESFEEARKEAQKAREALMTPTDQAEPAFYFWLEEGQDPIHQDDFIILLEREKRAGLWASSGDHEGGHPFAGQFDVDR